MRLRLITPLAAILAVLSACATAPVPVKEPVPATPPLASRFGLALDGRPISAERLASHASELGARPGAVVVFEQWPENPPGDLSGLGASLAAIRAAGATPVVTWEPMYYRADGTEVIVPVAHILAGRYDAYADAFAALLLATPGDAPVIVRLMHEPNLGRYHWGVGKNEYDARAPEVYRALWRHLVARVRAAAGPERAARIRFAFCPNAESVPGPGNSAAHAWNTISAYYPGDAWVDVIGVDGYNWGDTQTPAKHGWQSSWRSLSDILGPAVAELRALAPTKPLYVFETATAPTGGDKAAWLLDSAAAARRWGVEAVCWFEADKEVGWRLATGVPSEAPGAFVRALTAP